MADVVRESANVKSAIRTLAEPIADIGIPSFFCTRENNFVIPERAITNPG